VALFERFFAAELAMRHEFTAVLILPRNTKRSSMDLAFAIWNFCVAGDS